MPKLHLILLNKDIESLALAQLLLLAAARGRGLIHLKGGYRDALLAAARLLIVQHILGALAGHGCRGQTPTSAPPAEGQSVARKQRLSSSYREYSCAIPSAAPGTPSSISAGEISERVTARLRLPLGRGARKSMLLSAGLGRVKRASPLANGL